MSMNWQERFAKTRIAYSNCFKEVNDVWDEARIKWNTELDADSNNVGEDGAETAFYRFNASSRNKYPVYAKYNFAIVDLDGRKRYLTAQECDDKGFDFVIGTSINTPFSKNLNDTFYQAFLRAQERNRKVRQKEIDKVREQANSIRELHYAKPNRWPLYQEYLQSREWKQKRSEVLFRDGHSCQLCGDEEDLQIHHLTYNRVGDEALFDLVTLCSHCHAKEHGKEE